MHVIAFATASNVPRLTDDDRRAVDLLARRGIQTQAAIWNDPAVDWHAYECVVVRSCWDHHHQPEAFAGWIECLQQQGVPLWNKPQTLRWNMDKLYLRRLQQQGVPIPPTLWFDRGATIDLRAVLAGQDWSKAVVKPTISATAYQTWLTSREQAVEDNDRAAQVLTRSRLMVQQFMPEVTSAGEWSLLFFDKQYSHAVPKRPRQGDFRMQNDFGGSTEPAQPRSYLIEQAQPIVDLIAEPLLYARVDGVDAGGTFVLMELELIEPLLFLRSTDQAAARFSDAIVNCLA